MHAAAPRTTTPHYTRPRGSELESQNTDPRPFAVTNPSSSTPAHSSSSSGGGGGGGGGGSTAAAANSARRSRATVAEYGAFFQPTAEALHRTRIVACDGRLTVLAGGVSDVLAAHHPPRDAADAAGAAGAAAAAEPVGAGSGGGDAGALPAPGPPPALHDCGAATLPGLQCVWVAPETPVTGHLAPATWPQPPVYVPPHPPPPVGVPLPLPTLPLALPLSPPGGTPAQAVQALARPQPASQHAKGHAMPHQDPTQQPQQGPEHRPCQQARGGSGDGGEGGGGGGGGTVRAAWCGWCGGELDGGAGGLCERGCGGAAAALPAHQLSRPCTLRAIEVLGGIARRTSAATPAATPAGRGTGAADVHASEGRGAGTGLGGGWDSDSRRGLGGSQQSGSKAGREPSGDADGRGWRLTYLDLSYHRMYDGADAAALRAAMAAAAAASSTGVAAAGTAVSAAADTGPLSLLLAVLCCGHGRQLRHLVAAGASLGVRELRLLGAGDCCRRLSTLDLSGCSFPDLAAAPAAVAASAEAIHQGKQQQQQQQHRHQHRQQQQRPQGPQGRRRTAAERPREEAMEEAPPPPPAVVALGRELRAALGRLSCLRVLRLRDLDLRGLFTPGATAEGPAPSHGRTDTSQPQPQQGGGGIGGHTCKNTRPLADAAASPRAADTESVGATVAGGGSGRRYASGGAAGDGDGDGACSVKHECAGGGEGGGGGVVGGGGEGPPAWLDGPMGHTLAGLRHLDLEGSAGVGPRELTALLATATAVTHLGIGRCRDLALGGNGVAAAAAAAIAAAAAGSLRSLSAGWGFGAAVLRRLAERPCTALTALELGVGTTVDDVGLAAAAAGWPHLQRLSLTLCGVGGAGVGAALAACPKIHVLHVVNCVGPFRREDMLAPLGWLAPTASAAEAATTEVAGAGGAEGAQAGQAGVFGGPVMRWAMSDLRLVGGPMQLYDDDVASLLHGRPVYGKGVAADGVDSDGEKAGIAHRGNPGATGRSDGGGENGTEEQGYGSRLWGRGRRLRTLALVGCPFLTVRLLQHLQYGCTEVRHVRLERCPFGPLQGGGGAAAAAGCDAECLGDRIGGGRSGAAGRGDGDIDGGADGSVDVAHRSGGGGADSGDGSAAEALLAWLCRCQGLANLRVRHCFRWDDGVVARLTASCPSLETLMLDACDLPPRGFAANPSPYGALSYVMLARCRADTVRSGSGGGGGDGDGGGLSCGKGARAAIDRGGACGGTGIGGTGGDSGRGHARYSGAASAGAGSWWLPVERDVKIVRFVDGAVGKLPLYSLAAHAAV